MIFLSKISASLSSNYSFPKLKMGYVFLFWMLIATIAIIQDYLFSRIYQTGFYWSECLIFKAFWFGMTFFTLGIFFINQYIQSHIAGTRRQIFGHTIGLLLLSFIYLIIISFIIGEMAYRFLEVPFKPINIFKRYVADRFYLLIIIYTLVALFFHKNQNNTSAPAVSLPVVKQTPPSSNIEIAHNGKLHILEIDQINFIKSESPYGAIFYKGRKYLSYKNLKQLEEELESYSIQRIHRSILVNLNKIQELQSRGNGDYDLKLKDGTVLRMSRRFSQKVKKLIKR